MNAETDDLLRHLLFWLPILLSEVNYLFSFNLKRNKTVCLREKMISSLFVNPRLANITEESKSAIIPLIENKSKISPQSIMVCALC